jgi:mannitol/fructose-specific phosphotransferase system IIA component (Ntr-type)
LIAEMGLLAIAFTIGMVLVGLGWYFYYARGRVVREGAIYHLFARLGQYRYEGLDSELRTILKEKGLSDETPFEHLVTHAAVVDLAEERTFEDLVHQASALFAEHLPVSADTLAEGFLEGSRYGATPVSRGAALPHQRLAGLDRSYLVMVRCRPGLRLQLNAAEAVLHDPDEPVYAVFFLVSPEGYPGRHLRVLANIASRIDEPEFMAQWLRAGNEQQLKEALLRHDRYLSLLLSPDDQTAAWVGRAHKDLHLPPGNLIALIHRDGQMTVPSGNTVLMAGDRVTLIGDDEGIRQLRDQYRN